MKVSVVIPTYNRLASLRQTLETLASQQYPAHAWEIVVVDDGSRDGTTEGISAIAPTYPVPLRCLCLPNGGPALARNAGAQAARGEVLIFVDDDISVSASFVGQHTTALARNPGCWMVGKILNPPAIRETPFGRYRDDLSERFQRSEGRSASQTDLITAQNLSLPREDFERLGGFDTDFREASCEDMLLGLRARAAGIRILFDPSITVIHRDWAIDLGRFCERQRLYALSDVLLWRKLGDASPRRQVIEANSPVSWGSDPLRLVLKKLAKQALATAPGRGLTMGFCQALETIAPDSAATRAAYDTAAAAAMLRGVREGLRRYPTQR